MKTKRTKLFSVPTEVTTEQDVEIEAVDGSEAVRLIKSEQQGTKSSDSTVVSIKCKKPR